MEADDKIRGQNGVAISLRDLPDGKLRVVVDDVEKKGEAVADPWDHKCFVTHKHRAAPGAGRQVSQSRKALSSFR